MQDKRKRISLRHKITTHKKSFFVLFFFLSEGGNYPGRIIIGNVFPRVNNTSFVCPKLATVYEVCHIRYKSMETIMKAVTFVVCNA